MSIAFQVFTAYLALFQVLTTPFGTLAPATAALARRYDGKVQAYEIWNEENFTREWAPQVNAGAYVELLKVAHRRIKAVDPNLIVVSGALTPTGINNPSVAVDDTVYMSQLELYQGGVFKTVADAVGGHMAGYPARAGLEVGAVDATVVSWRPSSGHHSAWGITTNGWFARL